MRRWVSFLLLSILLSGCFQPSASLVAEKEEIAYRRGQQKIKEGRPDEALQAFLSVLSKRQEAPESHLEAGLLYLNRFNEPVLAIYHFSEYLRSKPNSEQAERVRALVLTAKKEFARSLPAAPFGGEVDKLDLKELLDKTRAENDSLKTELMQAREELERYKTLEQARLNLAANPAPNGTGGVSVEKPTRSTASAAAASGPGDNSSPAAASRRSRTYTVVEGDSLYIIAKKVYGSGPRWKEIADANRTNLPDPKRLKLGQTLTIP